MFILTVQSGDSIVWYWALYKNATWIPVRDFVLKFFKKKRILKRGPNPKSYNQNLELHWNSLCTQIINFTWADVCKNWLDIFSLIEFIRSVDTIICNDCQVCCVRRCISERKNIVRDQSWTFIVKFIHNL